MKTFNNNFLEIADKHPPFKERKIKPKQVPYMNKALRSAVYKQRMYNSKFQNVNSRKNLGAYRKQRNCVTKLKKQSINNYFIKRCTEGPK
jgi:hypothetical protein